MSKYASMTDEQIRDLLKTAYGITVRADASRASLEKKLAAAESGESEPDEPKNVVTKNAAAAPSDDVVSQLSGTKVKIKFFSSKDEKHDVVVNLNGRNYIMQRDKVIEIPIEVFWVIQNATKTEYYQNDGDPTLHPRDAPQYPYTLVQ